MNVQVSGLMVRASHVGYCRRFRASELLKIEAKDCGSLVLALDFNVLEQRCIVQARLKHLRSK